MKENNIQNFIGQLTESPKMCGKLVRDLIGDFNRLLLNFPVVGQARKISSQLKKNSFSSTPDKNDYI